MIFLIAIVPILALVANVTFLCSYHHVGKNYIKLKALFGPTSPKQHMRCLVKSLAVNPNMYVLLDIMHNGSIDGETEARFEDGKTLSMGDKGVDIECNCSRTPDVFR